MGDRTSVLARVLASPRLRRVEMAFVLFALGEYGVWLAVTVYAFQHGGTTTAALIAALQLLPAAVVAPLVARVTDQRGGPHMLLVGYLLQAASVTATAAVILAGGPSALAYVGAVVAASAVTITRPAQAATLASQVEHPDELTAANVLNSWADSGALLAGPGMAGVLIAVHGPGLALAAFGIGLVIAVCLVLAARIQPAAEALAWDEAGAARTPADHGDPEPEPQPPGRRPWTTGAGLAVLSVVAVQYVALGALDVLVVVLAVHTLHLGASYAGYLEAAFGAGSVLGAGAALRLVGASSLARPLCAAALTWALAYTLLGIFPLLGTAIGLLALAGLARSLVDTSGRALLARVTPMSRVGRVFGLLEGMTTAALAVGSLTVPLFYAVGGVRLDLLVVAVLLGGSALLPLRMLRIADRSAPAIDGLRRLHHHPLFARLSLPALEDLARQLVTLRLPAGTPVITEGEPGDRFYLVADGELEVSIADRHIRILGEGDGFGEIALLRDVPRTATVTVRDDAVVYALGRQPFLNAMGAMPPAASGLPGHADLDTLGTVPA